MEEYLTERKLWRGRCEEKGKKKKEEVEADLRDIKSESGAWKYITKFRNKRPGLENNITRGKWLEYFRDKKHQEKEEGKLRTFRK